MVQEPHTTEDQASEVAEQGGSGLDGPFTKFPHALTDQWMQVLSGDGWKVLSFVARQTIGWHRSRAFISLTDLMEGTGLPTRTVVLRAIREVCGLGAVVISDTVGYRGVKAYGIPPSALTGLLVVPVNPRRQKKRKRTATRTSVEPEPLPPRDQNPYQGETNSRTSLIPDTLPQIARGAVPHEPKETVKKGKDNSKENVRFERQKESQNALQNTAEYANRSFSQERLKAESNQSAASQELHSSRALRVDSQRSASRQRISARLNSPLEAQHPSSMPLPDRQAPRERTGVRLRPPPDRASPPASEDATEIAARRLRLLALQQELAQLKRTPSMQLLARQRIPRLEDAIKHLIASLAASA